MKTKNTHIPAYRILCRSMAGRLLFALALLCVALFNTCKQDNPCGGGTHTTCNLTSSATDTIPFTVAGFDTLVYISNTGDTAKLYGVGKQHFFNGVNEGSPDCPSSKTTSSEVILYEFKGSNSSLFEIYIKFHNDCYDDMFDIGVNNNLVAGGGSIGMFNAVAYYRDTVTINHKLFYGFSAYGGNTESDSLIVNNKSGILRIKFPNNQIYLKQ